MADFSDDHAQDILALLNLHGQHFLSGFGSSVVTSFKRKADALDESEDAAASSDEGVEDNEEWGGIGSDEAESEEDDEPVVPTNVTVFSQPGGSSSSTLSNRVSRKSFMSSKVSRLAHAEPSENMAEDDVDDTEEMTNAQNDALLHKLVHTQLLSGALNSDLELTPAQRRKAMAGRVMELAGKSSMGKGERSVRDAERNKAAKRVREGMLQKQKERTSKALEEAKELGNYHPSLKKAYASSDDRSAPKKREKGLRMGVGKFRGGVLNLTQQDIATATGSRRGMKSGRGRPKGRGGKRK